MKILTLKKNNFAYRYYFPCIWA